MIKADDNKRHKASSIFLEYHNYVKWIAFETAPCLDYQNDIVNDCFIEFVEKAEQWNYESDFRPLLCGMTRNIALRYWRKHLRYLPENMQKIMEHLRYRFNETESESEYSQLDREKIALDSCFDLLTPDNQSLIKKYYYENQPLLILSEIFGQTANALCKRLARIRIIIKRCIEKKFSEDQYDL